MTFLTFACAVDADQGQTEFKYGERPANSICDPKEILTVQEAREISEPLQVVRENEGIDVMVVVLPEIGDAPPLHVARGFAEKWTQTRINAVVLHVPGLEDSPWIFPGKVMSSTLKPEVMKMSIEAAVSRARAEPTDFDKVRAASIEAADVMRFWMGNAVIRSEEVISRNQQARDAYEKRQRLIKLSLALGAASAIPLIVGGAFFFFRLRNAGAKRFPPTRVIKRLGAPYSGGNSATTADIQPASK
ncbi:MAG: hypothetical protein ABJQ29_01955 [Luteolibacter sp.]